MIGKGSKVLQKIGKWIIMAGMLLGLLDLLLITLMPHKPLPRGVGFLMPLGVGLGYLGSLFRERRKDG
jgi:hypothetical protein